LEQTFEATSKAEESPELYETLEKLKTNPMDINKAKADELVRIPWITRAMASAIVEYRKVVGLFKEPSELKNVKGFSTTIVERIAPYVTVAKPQPALVRHYEIRNRVADENPETPGYLGSSTRLYNRVVADIGERVSVAGLVEKDPYEQRLLDFWSLSAEVKDLGPLGSTVIGDYSLDFGEGLVLSPRSYSIKGSGITKGSERSIVPNRSAAEAGLLRGAATTFAYGDLSICGFLSDAKLDASVNEEGLVTSIYEDGLHRTPAEVDKSDRLRETLFGARTFISTHRFKFGMTGYSGKYEPAIAKRDLDYYEFSGSSYQVLGSDFEADLGSTELFGEIAKSISLGQGYLMGLSYKEKGTDAAVVFRHYDENFYSPHSGGFCDSDDENEEGGYFEISHRLSPHTKLSGFMDLSRKLGPSYGNAYPINGRDFRLEIEQSLDKRVGLKARVFAKGKGGSSEEDDTYFNDRRGFRIQAEVRPSSRASLVARFETVSAFPEEGSVETGSLLYWEAALKPTGRLSVKGRLSVFEIGSWDARLYQFESDIPGVIRNAVVSGDGASSYCLAAFSATRWLKLSGKISWITEDEETRWQAGGQTDIDFKMPVQ
jgi:hypothetical protein